MSKTFRVVISGGGTGGHIYPAIAIANALKKAVPDCEILFVGASGRMEMEKVPEAGYKITGLPVAGLQRKLSLSNLKLPFKLIKSLHKASHILRSFRPDIAVGVGGYASGPLLWSASRRKIPFIVQEQNAFAGLTNKILAKKAQRFCVAYEGMEKFFPKERIVLTGNPIREDIKPADAETKARALEFFSLDPARKTLLVVGGSLGSRTLNQCMETFLHGGGDPNLQIIWQCGKYYYNSRMEALTAPYAGRVKLHAFIGKMQYAYAAADVVISRAGAASIAELCAAGKACIFVPSPNVTEDHQTHNARALTDKDAALMVSDAQAPEILMQTALDLCQESERIRRLEKNMLALARPDAAGAIAQIVLKEGGYEA